MTSLVKTCRNLRRAHFQWLICFSVGFAGALWAQSIPVTNPGFEDIAGQTVFNEFTFGTPLGWDLYDPLGVAGADGTFIGTLQNPEDNFFSEPAPEGTRVGILFNAQRQGTGEYGFQQTVAATLQPFTRYELTVEVGDIDSGTASNGTFFNLEGFPGYRVELLADLEEGIGDEVVLAADDNELTASLAEGEFELSVVLFETAGTHPQLGQSIAIRLVNENEIPVGVDPLPDLEVDFDDVQLSISALDDLIFVDSFE